MLPLREAFSLQIPLPCLVGDLSRFSALEFAPEGFLRAACKVKKMRTLHLREFLKAAASGSQNVMANGSIPRPWMKRRRLQFGVSPKQAVGNAQPSADEIMLGSLKQLSEPGEANWLARAVYGAPSCDPRPRQ